MFWNKIKQFTKGIHIHNGVRVLVIEDSEIDQRVTCTAIERGGYSVLKASDGKAGLEMARKFLPDLIILDYNLPDTKGPEICKILKYDELTKAIPVLFLTGMDSPGSIIDCYEQGAANYLAKPVNPHFLLKQIDQALKDKNTKE